MGRSKKQEYRRMDDGIGSSSDKTIEVGKEIGSMRGVFLRSIAISLIPLVVMAVTVIFMENLYFRSILKEEIRRELRTSAYILSDSYALVDPGDFTKHEDGNVYKGPEKVSGFLDQINDELEKAGIVCTFFFENTRIDTTVEDEHGSNMAGTVLDEEIYGKLCSTKEELFCEEAKLGGRTYYGYYIPFINSNGKVAAAVFAGRLQSEVFANSGDYTFTVLWMTLLVLIIGVIVSLFCSIYTVGYAVRQIRAHQDQSVRGEIARNQMDFMTLISREVRDPVDTITILSDRILEEETSPDIRGSVLGIKESCNAMLTSFNTIHEYSVLETGDVTVIKDEYELTKLVDECSARISPGVERKKLDYSVDYDRNMPNVLKGDYTKISQILDNLLGNSVKYTYDGSIKLNVSFRTITPDKIDVTFTITDTGVGIRKEDARMLFNSIGKVGENKNVSIKGTGLGLLICKRLVSILDGKISVESEIGKGSVFRFSVPQDVAGKITVGAVKNDI